MLDTRESCCQALCICFYEHYVENITPVITEGTNRSIIIIIIIPAYYCPTAGQRPLLIQRRHEH